MATLQRRKKDLETMRDLERRSRQFDFRFRVMEGGDAPTKYEMIFHCRTYIYDPDQGKVVRTDSDYEHKVEIFLDANYPKEPPRLEWKTDIFHSNIHNGVACILGGLWDPERTLADVCRQLMEMAQFNNHDPDHCLPSAVQESQWAKVQPAGAFPAGDHRVLDK